MFSNINILYKIMVIPGILLGFVLHEFAHAKMADRLGDPTPRSQGRLTLDPRAHIDLIGFIMIVLIGFGWAKPVMTDSRYYKRPKRDDILVSLAGPVMNLIIAVVFVLLIKLVDITGLFAANISLRSNIVNLFFITAQINVLLFVLNLLPFPFFDGYHIITNIFNTWKYRFFNLLEQYNMIIFILLAFTGVFDKIITPLVTIILNLILMIL